MEITLKEVEEKSYQDIYIFRTVLQCNEKEPCEILIEVSPQDFLQTYIEYYAWIAGGNECLYYFQEANAQLSGFFWLSKMPTIDPDFQNEAYLDEFEVIYFDKHGKKYNANVELIDNFICDLEAQIGQQEYYDDVPLLAEKMIEKFILEHKLNKAKEPSMKIKV